MDKITKLNHDKYKCINIFVLLLYLRCVFRQFYHYNILFLLISELSWIHCVCVSWSNEISTRFELQFYIWFFPVNKGLENGVLLKTHL